MQALRDVESGELRWVRPKASKHTFELHAGETVVATLAWIRGSRAIGQWADGHYQFSREGWFRQRIIVRVAPINAANTPDAPDEPVATFVHRTGTLTFPDDRVFRWQKPKRWTNERVWVDTETSVLVRFRPERQATAVVVSPPAAASSQVPLLILLGQYLLVLAADDAVAASTAATVAIIGSS